MTERFYVPVIKYFLGEPVRIIEVNNVEYLVCKDMFSVLGRVRADGTWDKAKSKLLEFTKPARTISDPTIFRVTCKTDKLKSRDTQEVLCIRLEEGNRKELRSHTLIEKIRKEVETMKSLGLSTEQNFLFSEYKDKSGKTNPTFLMNRDGILQIASSESVYVRAKIIEYINALENKIVEQQFKLPTTYKEAVSTIIIWRIIYNIETAFK